jgi:hypothetical protein
LPDIIEERNEEQVPYAHTREKSEKSVKNVRAMGNIRTDSQALTLDKFLNQGNVSESAQSKVQNGIGVNTLIPIKLASVKKLIYSYEQDSDPQLQKSFKKHSYVGFLQPDQILI